MRSDLSKSLKLNSAESGCLEGESREERVGCGVERRAETQDTERTRPNLPNRCSSKILLLDAERDK